MGLYELTVDFDLVTISDSKVRGNIRLYLVIREKSRGELLFQTP